MAENGPENLSQTFEVLEGEWQSLAHEGLIFSTRIETCIAVSLYSPLKKKAFLGHFFDVSALDQNGGFAEMMQAAVEISNSSDLQIWVGGGLLIDPDLPEERGHFSKLTVQDLNTETLYFRERALEEVSRLGAQPRSHWLDQPADIDYVLNVATGEETIAVNERQY